MPEQRIVVERHLRIHRQEGEPSIGFGDDTERIDFNQRRVTFPPGAVQSGKSLHRRGDQVACQAQGHRQFPALVRLETERGVYEFPDDFLRCPGGHLFNIHAALGAGHDDRTPARAIEQDRGIEFPADIGRQGHEYAVDPAARGPGLGGDQYVAQHRLRESVRLIRGGPDLDAAAITVGEGAFPRPPAWICALTTNLTAPSASKRSATARASSAVSHSPSGGRGTPRGINRDLA